MKIIYSYERSGLTEKYLDGSTERLCVYCTDNHNPTFSDGFVLYEIEPQNRSLFIKSNFDNSTKLVKMKLPYLYFGLRYFKFDNNDNFKKNYFVYPGVHQNGLQLSCSDSPVQSFQDLTWCLGTDPLGYVCTDHKYDRTQYATLNELSSTIIGSWYRLAHYCPEDWSSSRFDVRKRKQLNEFLMCSKFNHEAQLKSVVIPSNAKIKR